MSRQWDRLDAQVTPPEYNETMNDTPYYEPLTDTSDYLGLIEAASNTPSGQRILSVCMGVARFLLAKNKAYGDSALDPLRIFSKSSAEEQILVRLDDKLSRLKRGSAAGEDVVLDLLGYLVLLLASREEQR
jgi:hypothetical protein